jgi:hypothetical protein
MLSPAKTGSSLAQADAEGGERAAIVLERGAQIEASTDQSACAVKGRRLIRWTELRECWMLSDQGDQGDQRGTQCGVEDGENGGLGGAAQIEDERDAATATSCSRNLRGAGRRFTRAPVDTSVVGALAVGRLDRSATACATGRRPSGGAVTATDPCAPRRRAGRWSTSCDPGMDAQRRSMRDHDVRGGSSGDLFPRTSHAAHRARVRSGLPVTGVVARRGDPERSAVRLMENRNCARMLPRW